MNTGQTLLTIGAIALLSLTLLRINSNFLSTSSVLTQTQTGIFAVSYATSILEKATSLAFDENSRVDFGGETGFLTAILALGPESGETVQTFDDFDDYNNYVSVDSLPNGYYETRCFVYYVNDLTPTTPANIRTWHKRIDVRVTSDQLKNWATEKQDTIRLSTVFSYWYYR